MDKSLRNTLRNVVTQCRRLLEEAVAEVLEGQFGIYASGKIEAADRMGHLSADDREYREQLLVHLQHIQAGGFKTKDAVEQLVREVAFTHLNRFCAYKMMETRSLIRKAVSDGLKSQGFLFYLADYPEEEQLYNEGKQDVAYRHFLEWLGGTLSEEIGVLFSPHDPANRLLPTQRVLDLVLELINSEELKDIWVEDETIGWVYQYFTPKELRDKARKESQAPRNSYELAFRNQFYTPSYVVQFLTDNTLGRIWYEMRKGETVLKEQCQYLVRRPNEVFLAASEQAPQTNGSTEDLSQEELLKQPVYIPHRPKKDPRSLKILDPACGSGHFLLYCFTLLLIIYEEAYDDSQLGSALQQDYPDREEYRKAVPGLILAHNLHGIDIDLRATQIAALALWLRAQKAYQEMGIKKNRPKITKSNIVCAEPMPGEKELLDEFVAELQPKVLGQLVRVMFNKMKLAGEAGSLLNIEEEIKDIVAEAKQQWKTEQLTLFPEYEQPQPEQLNLFDVADVTDEEFWNQAETRVFEALRDYANRAVGSQKLLRQLFAGDAVQGFAFIDICRKRFDVVLMNPPFGDATERTVDILTEHFPIAQKNLYMGFVIGGFNRLTKTGLLGAITDATFIHKTRYEGFRRSLLNNPNLSLRLMAANGWGVLDSYVETASFVVAAANDLHSLFFDIRNLDEQRDSALHEAIFQLNRGELLEITKLLPLDAFIQVSKSVLAFWLPSQILSSYRRGQPINPKFIDARTGIASGDNYRFYKLWWEVDARQIGRDKIWTFLANGGYPSPLYRQQIYVVNYFNNGAEVKQYVQENYGGESRTIINQNYYYRAGLTFGKRTESFTAQYLPEDQIFSTEGQAIFPKNNVSYEPILAFLNSSLVAYLLNSIAGQHKEAGYVGSLPSPPDDFIKSSSVTSYIHRSYQLLLNLGSSIPESQFFLSPFAQITETIPPSIIDISNRAKSFEEEFAQAFLSIDSFLEKSMSFSEEAPPPWERRQWSIIKVIYESELSELPGFIAIDLLGYGVGTIFGRWDVRIAKNLSLAPMLTEPLEALPVCSPASLVSPDGLPAISGNIVSEEWLCARPKANTLPPEGSVQQPTIPDSEYPIAIDWDGILVDDPDHPDDIIRRVRDVLEVIWSDKSEAIEKEACEILGIKDLRDYFRKSSKGGFWMDHVSRYTKSRRKAPIYWLLQSSKKNYALWIYYHRLDKDILFKALIIYVEPKRRLEESNLEQLRKDKATAGNTGKAAKQLEKQIDRQEALVSELHDFEEKLRRAANLNLEPDLNDGVVLNIAPLWELVPWNEAKKYWQELIAGKYEWSSIGKQLKAKGKVKC
ncbi:BREX-1 system adenine-specific DNA-methyltransferase PglX [Coleofasciculus sp. FACHB-712]|uniref:BREX-1 system adenine-specific DNA-methyltransferase PglX n=1 Tax=Coleofasciculus sp. FACHB-712 TaxID=2692789 RepID=UPI001687784D|nr:BREX-1 system adenine-specific DNA-methyltransferase PglX [Coleofasciculus sp. FACHB-712]MBD1944341.1 BREX-1 system adenine-specific DNA-methyltransferase PglX [Coleofasciculus sp. FACHB-712]